MAGRYYETAASTGSHADLKSEMVALKHTIAVAQSSEIVCLRQ